MQPRVAIIILCYNGYADTLACLQSLAALDYPAERLEVIIVDNASHDETVEAVGTRFPTVRVIANCENLGYAAGNNVGLRYAVEYGFDYALLLNNDTEVEPQFLQSLVQVAAANPQVAMAGPTIYYHHAPTTIWSAGGQIDWQHGTSRMRGLDQREQGQFASATDVDFISGCALLCRCAALTAIGMIDERFFMYYEETEWCVRAWRAGFRCVHVPEARIWHKIRPDRQARSMRVAYYMTRNRLLFLRAVGVAPLVWLRALLLQDVRACVSITLRPKWRARRPQRNAVVRAWRDFFTGRFGRAEGL